MKKQYLHAILCTLPLLFAACDDDSNHEQSSLLSTTADVNNVSSELSLNNGTTGSLQGYSSSSDETQPVYKYTQAFTNVDNSYEKSTEFSYSFVVDSKKVEIWAKYKSLTDQPYAASIKTYKPSTVNGTETWINESTYFCSSEESPACSNINLTLDQKTGNSTLNFNQAELYSVGSNSEKIKLNGSVTGLLAKLPTQPNPIMASSDYILEYRSDNTSGMTDNVGVASQYRTLKFTNHNMNFFSTGSDTTGYFRINFSLEIGVTNVYTIDDQIDRISNNFSGYVILDKDANLATQTTYNPQTYVVSFNNTKFSSIDASKSIYMTGNIGP